jgi:hypothetical protein
VIRWTMDRGQSNLGLGGIYELHVTAANEMVGRNDMGKVTGLRTKYGSMHSSTHRRLAYEPSSRRGCSMLVRLGQSLPALTCRAHVQDLGKPRPAFSKSVNLTRLAGLVNASGRDSPPTRSPRYAMQLACHDHQK